MGNIGRVPCFQRSEKPAAASHSAVYGTKSSMRCASSPSVGHEGVRLTAALRRWVVPAVSWTTLHRVPRTRMAHRSHKAGARIHHVPSPQRDAKAECESPLDAIHRPTTVSARISRSRLPKWQLLCGVHRLWTSSEPLAGRANRPHHPTDISRLLPPFAGRLP